MTGQSKIDVDSQDAANLSILVSHAQLQDSLLQSYRQIYIGLQAILLAIGIGVVAVLLTQNAVRYDLFWFLFAVTIVAIYSIKQVRSIVLARTRDVTWWHIRILGFEALMKPESRIYTQFKVSQQTLAKQNDLKQKYLQDRGAESFDDLVEATRPGHARRVLEWQLFYGSLVVWFLILATAIWFTFMTEHPEEKISWQQVQLLVDRAEYEKAIEISQSLIKKSPNYWYGYSHLGNIYLATGDLKKAETNYALAFDLFSSPENEKTLKAIRRTVEVNRRKLKQH
jgi:hypothetical protein